MRTKKLTKKDRANLRLGKWIVFERSLTECLNICNNLRNQAVTLEQRKRVAVLTQRIRNAFRREAILLGWVNQKLDQPLTIFPSNKARTRLSIEA